MQLTNIKIEFGSITFSKAKDIHVAFSGFDVQIEEIAFKSNFFNSEISNPVQIYIRDVRVNKNVERSDEATPKKQKLQAEEPIRQIPKILLTLLQVSNSRLLSKFEICTDKFIAFSVYGNQCFQHIVQLIEYGL